MLSTLEVIPLTPTSSLSRWRDSVRGWDTAMLALAGLMTVMTVVSIGGLLLDERMLGGQPIWTKPLKFSISIALYALTWAWLASLITRAPRLKWWGSRIVVALLLVEMVAIVGQVVRGRASHFNNETPFDNWVFRVMGAAITGVWIVTLVLTVVISRSAVSDPASRAAIRLGPAISLYGMAVAFLMATPTADQLERMQAGRHSPMIGAHSVGVADGGPGLPLLGWSTTGGDLRIAHFIGLHALQALPLLAIALSVLAARWPALRDEIVRARLVRIGAAAYFGLCVLFTWQALRGQSIVAPDAITLTAFGVLVAGTALASAWAVRARSPRREEVAA